MKKYSHLSLEDRIEIQDCLYHGVSFKKIAKRIGRDQTTVSKEIKRNITIKPKELGKNYESYPCPLLLKPPFVCNPCKKLRCHCSFQKQVYYSKMADNAYSKRLSESREGIPLNQEEFYDLDNTLTTCLRKGQRLYHAFKTYNFSKSIATIYNYQKKGYLSSSATDFPRIAKFKPRKKKYIETVPKKLKLGRLYSDFLAFCEEKAIFSWVEMDTVIGRIGGKTILTLIFTDCNFMIGLLLDSKSSIEVANRIYDLKKHLIQNGESFENIFPVILTDNGGEFSNISAVEKSISGKETCRLFFCDPYQSSQKPRVEKNHTIFRDIVPSKSSFDCFTQENVNLIFSHVNSIKRHSLHGKTPYELFSFLHGEKIANLLGIKNISAEEVIQSPKLIKKFI
jgi:IS30 family transposase